MGSGSLGSPPTGWPARGLVIVEPNVGVRTRDIHTRLRHDVVDGSGCATLRHNGRLHHIGMERTHARTRVLLLIQVLEIRIVNAATGELSLDPNRDCQPPEHPKDPPRNDETRRTCRFTGFPMS